MRPFCSVTPRAPRSHPHTPVITGDSVAVVGGFEARDYDSAMELAIDALPSWVSAQLEDTIFRVEAQQHVLEPERPDHRITLYRQPALTQAATASELERLVRVDLLRAIVRQLQLEGPQALTLASACL